ncbi:MAG: glycosyltransferase family 2 protein [Bacteroidota bacterium]
MSPISAVVITHNEERNIERCLASLQNVADEIIVVDSFSTDRTEEICKSFNVKFYQRKWDDYSSAKNFGNEKAAYDWILSLDADEALSDELKKNILEIKSKNEIVRMDSFGGNYKFNRLTNYCGKWIRHCGWYPGTRTRLFNSKECHWEGTIHEQLTINSKLPVVFLEGDCFHFSYYTIEEHINKTEKFTTLSAAELFRRNKKASFMKIYISPVFKFIQSYFLKLGILDGYYGFMICKISALSVYLKYYKLKQFYK